MKPNYRYLTIVIIFLLAASVTVGVGIVVHFIAPAAQVNIAAKSPDSTNQIEPSSQDLQTSAPTPFSTPVPISTPTPTPSPSPEPTPLPVYNVKLTTVGDLMLHEWQYNNAYDKASDSFDFDYCFQEVKKYLTDSDFTIGNLETTFAGKEAGYGFYPLFSAPDDYGYALKNTGFDFLTTANNHSNDKRESGILRTLDVLDSLEIDHTGTFRNADERYKIYIKEINNIRFALLSYSYGTNGIPVAEGKPYLINLLDEGLIRDDIRRAKEYNPDFIIVFPHMGDEYKTYPADSYKNWASKMFEAGADIVLASHPHVLQPLEFVTVADSDGTERECFVAYSMGNFISSQRDEPREASAIFNLYFEKTEGQKAILKNVGYTPTWVKFVNEKGVYDIQVLPVYETIKAHISGEPTGLSSKDINRVMRVHDEVNLMLSNKKIPIEDIQNEYLLKDE